jgi:hypothetical protein
MLVRDCCVLVAVAWRFEASNRTGPRHAGVAEAGSLLVDLDTGTQYGAQNSKGAPSAAILDKRGVRDGD